MFQGNRRFEITAVKALIAINVLVFVLMGVSPSLADFMDGIFALSSRGLAKGMIWQFVTYQFIHAGFFHLLVNMLGLWFAGNILERIFGARRFVIFYLLCGIAGGLLQIAFSPGPAMVVGASGAVCGLVAAFSTMFPQMPVTALIFFVIPVRMRAMWLGIIVACVSLFLMITGWFGDIGNAAHLGGAIAGFGLVKFNRRRERFY
ncbi:MAG: rhomboid family intramembrane serine protease [Terrimicrobiaceae bacterium]